VVVMGMDHGMGWGRCKYDTDMSILERGIHLGNNGVVLDMKGRDNEEYGRRWGMA
jgi:hypothetical protein